MSSGFGGFDIGLPVVRGLSECHGERVWCKESRIFPVWLQAGFWGLVAGSALLIGAALGYFARIPQRLIAAIMAFGSGV